MMQATDFRNLHDRAHIRPLDWPPTRCILLEHEVSAVIVREIAGQDAVQVAFVQDEDGARGDWMAGAPGNEADHLGSAVKKLGIRRPSRVATGGDAPAW